MELDSGPLQKYKCLFLLSHLTSSVAKTLLFLLIIQESIRIAINTLSLFVGLHFKQ